MAKNDTKGPMPSDVLQAVALLTRLPVPSDDAPRGAAAAWAYPLVGLVVGGIAAVVGAVAYGLGLPSPLCALLSLTMMIALTGAMHEDGLADTVDGLWGGWTRDARLEIMKDSHIGTYGVLALILATGARWGALWLLFEAGVGTASIALIVAPSVSRGALPALMATLPHARETGLSHSVGAASGSNAWIACGIAALIAVVFTGTSIVGVIFWTALLTALLALIARRKIGGQTGDILGACQQITEIAVLWSLLA